MSSSVSGPPHKARLVAVLPALDIPTYMPPTTRSSGKRPRSASHTPHDGPGRQSNKKGKTSHPVDTSMDVSGSQTTTHHRPISTHRRSLPYNQRTASPFFDSTFSGTPSPATSPWGGAEPDVWPLDAAGEQRHYEIVQATEGMSIGDHVTVGVTMDVDEDEMMIDDPPTPPLYTSIPSVQLHPPTPVLPLPVFQSVATPQTSTYAGGRTVHTLHGRLQQHSPHKKRYTMGPREGCEKCRLKIPGHYGHID